MGVAGRADAPDKLVPHIGVDRNVRSAGVVQKRAIQVSYDMRGRVRRAALSYSIPVRGCYLVGEGALSADARHIGDSP
jgi:hypothetical protein